MREQANLAIEMADVIIFLTDIKQRGDSSRSRNSVDVKKVWKTNSASM